MTPKTTNQMIKRLICCWCFLISNQLYAQQAPTDPQEVEAWRFAQVEKLLYIEDAEKTLSASIGLLDTVRLNADKNFRASQLQRFTQYNCPPGGALSAVIEHVDANITAARIYQKYGRYFLCIRQYDEAEETLIKAVSLFRLGFGHEALMERTDDNYFHEVREYFDTSLKNTMDLIEAASTHRAMDKVRELGSQYFAFSGGDNEAKSTLRNNLVEQLEDAIALTKAAGYLQEEDEAREILRQVLES